MYRIIFTLNLESNLFDSKQRYSIIIVIVAKLILLGRGDGTADKKNRISFICPYSVVWNCLRFESLGFHFSWKMFLRIYYFSL